MRKFAAVLAALLLLPALPTAQAPVVKLECTAANYPLCGASNHEFNVPSATCTNSHCKLGVYWDAVFQAGAGPAGENVVTITHLPTASIVEYYLGWGWSNPANLSPGATGCRYPRFWIYVEPPVVWNGPGGGRVGGKTVILGSDGTFDSARYLGNVRSNKNPDHDPTRWYLDANKNTGLGLAVPNLIGGVWTPVQTEVCLGPNATTKAWVGTNPGGYATPTAQASVGAWAPDGWTGSNARVSFGAYWQSAASGSNVRYRVIASGAHSFEVGTTFDPNWHLNGPVTPPSPAPVVPTAIVLP